METPAAGTSGTSWSTLTPGDSFHDGFPTQLFIYITKNIWRVKNTFKIFFRIYLSSGSVISGGYILVAYILEWDMVKRTEEYKAKISINNN